MSIKVSPDLESNTPEMLFWFVGTGVCVGIALLGFSQLEGLGPISAGEALATTFVSGLAAIGFGVKFLLAASGH